MDNNEICNHGAISPVSLLKSLHDNQGSSGRHGCAICAFEEGFIEGSLGNYNSYTTFVEQLTDFETCKEGSAAPTSILQNLGRNQGGAGRHKCVICAFKNGFQDAILSDSVFDITLEKTHIPLSIKKPKNKNSKLTNKDFLEIEINNKHLGLLGEKFILQHEINYLKSIGKYDLAQNVEHVSVEKGDGLGYDIISYDKDENQIMIEVKTTRGNISRPFFISRHELNKSSEIGSNYFLYRLFDFDNRRHSGKYYVIKGDLNHHLKLTPINFIANPKP
jgi:hypothetical protein